MERLCGCKHDLQVVQVVLERSIELSTLRKGFSKGCRTLSGRRVYHL